MIKWPLTRRTFAIGVGLAVLAHLGGCNTYTLKGKVVRGETSSVELVHEMDPRIRAVAPGGVGNVDVRVYRDPDTMNKKLSGRERTETDGMFSIGLGDFGAGWMQEQWLIQAACTGYANAELTTRLPSKNAKTRLLITLAPGTATDPDAAEDYLQDFEEFK
jgi:hypothetical protein